MKRHALLVVLLTLFTASLSAQTVTNSISGKWNVKIEGVSQQGHHFPNVELELQLEGKKVTGNFVIPDHGDLPLEGVFNDGTLIMQATEDGYMKMDLTGKLKEDGTLAGSIKGQMGEMTWTAKRVD